ncbi:MAG: ThuA domain-containing protein, partial [Phycisphaerae bacterium]|nr:ThuA domain-containing protein [Phycisphaerae bacterium]
TTASIPSNAHQPAATKPGVAESAASLPLIVFIAAEPEYDSPTSLGALAKSLDPARFRTTLLTPAPNQDIADNLPGTEVLDHAAAVVLCARFQRWPAEQLAPLERYLKRSGGIVALRTSTHAFAYDAASPLSSWNSFGPRVLGAPWIYHYGHDSSTAVDIDQANHDHQLLRGVAPFTSRSWLYCLNPPSTPTLGTFPPTGASVLLRGKSLDQSGAAPADRPIEPVAWTLENEWCGRVFTTTLGHPDDFKNEGFVRLLGNAIGWASEARADTKGQTAQPSRDTK